MTFDLDTLLRAAQLLNLVIIPATAWLVSRLRKGLVSDAELAKELKTRDQATLDIDHRVAAIEHRLEHMPDGDDLSELREALAGLSSDIRNWGRETDVIRTTLTRIEDFLLNKNGGPR